MPKFRGRRLDTVIFVAMALISLASVLFAPTLAFAQASKATPTPTVTFTATPTVTPTDSLEVFKTPDTPTPDPQQVYISSPLEGSLVQGTVNITGKTDVRGSSGYDLEFAFEQNPAETWFLISRDTQPVLDSQLAEWDTNSLTDGDYSLRLRVFFLDGSWRDFVVPSIKVRNYTAPQTEVPSATSQLVPSMIPTSTSTSTRTPMPTPSPFPQNVAELSKSQVLTSLGRGALFTLLLFVLFVLLLRSRNRRN